MGAAESAEAEADGPGVATGLLKLKLQRSKGEISEEQYDAGALANPRAPPPRARPPHPRPALPCPAAHRDAILALYVACLASREPLHTAYQPFISCAVRGRARPVAPWVSAVRPRVTVVCALHGGVCRICRRGQGAAGGRRRERGAGSAQRRRGSTQRRSGSGAGASCTPSAVPAPAATAPALNGSAAAPAPAAAPSASAVVPPVKAAVAAEAPVAPTSMATAPAQVPVQFEPIDLGEGGLGIKVVRLKQMRGSGKISEAHFEWALKRLLRVRTFGCPGEHELIRSDTSLPGWTCNVCAKALPLKTTVFSCRDCDWDGCKDCLNEAKRTAAAEVKYDWWGDEEEEEAETDMDAPYLVERVRFECAKKCVLVKTRTNSDLFECNLCGQRMPTKALVFSCRDCDFDGCGLCYARDFANQTAAAAAAAAASTPAAPAPGPSPAAAVTAATAPAAATPPVAGVPIKKDEKMEEEEDDVGLRCPGGHAVCEYCTPDADWACDLCRTEQKSGGFMLGCRVCNWDVCLPCAAANSAKIPV